MSNSAPDFVHHGNSPWWAVWDSTSFIPRSQCGDWPVGLIAAWCIQSVVILLLYTGVAIDTLRVYAKTRDVAKGRENRFPRRHLLWVAMFFLGCGGGHISNALSFFWPAYKVFILWDWLTLMVSIRGAWGLRKISSWADARVAAAENREEKAKGSLSTAILREQENLEELQIIAKEVEFRIESAKHELGRVIHQLKNEKDRLQVMAQLASAEQSNRLLVARMLVDADTARRGSESNHPIDPPTEIDS